MLFPQSAAAEKILAQESEWTAFTDGRVGAFVSYVRGDALPRPTLDAEGNIHDLQGGGFGAFAERTMDAAGVLTPEGKLEGMRIRTGFVGNTVGFGVKAQYKYATITGYIQIWALIESEERQKGNQPNFADVRQGYAKVEGRWGTVLAGRSRGLFSRGATDIDVLYGHRYGLGFPGRIDSNGPTAGHIGFGVLGSGFGAGMVYATPLLGGLQLTAGVYDPIQLQGAWTRTRWPRPEAELTFERPLGAIGKFVLFGNGAYQKLYKVDSTESTAAGGFGYGGRLEIGPARLGLAGHYGSGLGLGYALEASAAAVDPQTRLRKFDGYYVQSQLAFSKVDLSAGWGIVRVFLNPTDVVPDPTGAFHSVIKHQMGISAGVVYHVTPSFHLDLDGFRAEAAWFLGEKQVVYIANSGMTFTW